MLTCANQKHHSPQAEDDWLVAHSLSSWMAGLIGGEEWSVVCIPGQSHHCHTAWVYMAGYAEHIHVNLTLTIRAVRLL